MRAPTWTRFFWSTPSTTNPTSPSPTRILLRWVWLRFTQNRRFCSRLSILSRKLFHYLSSDFFFFFSTHRPPDVSYRNSVLLCYVEFGWRNTRDSLRNENRSFALFTTRTSAIEQISWFLKLVIPRHFILIKWLLIFFYPLCKLLCIYLLQWIVICMWVDVFNVEKHYCND